MSIEQGLIKFFSNWEQWRSKRDLYSGLSSFFKQIDEKRVLSIYTKSKVEAEGAMRFIWSSDGVVKKVPVKLAQASLNSNNLFVREFNRNTCYYIFLLGENEKQTYIAELKLSLTLDGLVTDFLFEYLYKGFNKLLYFTDRQTLLNLAFSDDVTGFYNQRKLTRDLNALGREYEQTEKPFSVLFVDIDHFKNINDNYGHIIGSELLRVLSLKIQTVLRSDDLLYRYGGDEFVLILPSTGREGGKIIGERIISAITSHTFKVGEVEFSLSISIGVAQYPDDANDTISVLELADKMMYEAKCKGRGRVCSTNEIFSEGT